MLILVCQSLAAQESAKAAAPAAEAGIEAKEAKQLALGFTNNVLLDGFLIPNIGFDMPFARHFSASAVWHHSWWKLDHQSVVHWKTYGVEGAVNYWFGKQELATRRGHHVGVFGKGFTYDFSHRHHGQMSNEHRWNYMAGVEYGFRLPIGSHVAVDFYVGVGYWGGHYKKYDRIDGHLVWTGTHKRQYFGPCTGGITFVWTPWALAKKKKGGAVL